MRRGSKQSTAEVEGESGETDISLEEEVSLGVDDSDTDVDDSDSEEEDEEEDIVFYKGSRKDVWFVGPPGQKLATDWNKDDLMDIFVVIPDTMFLMFRLQKGISIPEKKLKNFVVQKWGGDLNNPKLFFRASELKEDVGNFARKKVPGGGKPGKPVFILTCGCCEAEAHSGKLWHCRGCGQGFATKSFFDSQKHHPREESCQLWERKLLLDPQEKKSVWGKSKDTLSFPYGAPGGKEAKKNGFSPRKKQ